MKRGINKLKDLDWTTVFIYIIMVFMGWLNIYAAVYNDEHQSIFDFSQRYGKQLVWIASSFFIAYFVIIIDSRFYSIFAYVIYGVAILLLIVVLIFGKEVNNSRAWFEFGSLRLQPAEFAKIGTCLALAKYLSGFNIKIKQQKNLINLITIIFLPAILILLEKDAGTTLVYIAFVFVLYREGLSGGVLLIGVGIIVLFLVTLILTKLVILAVLLSIASIGYALVSKNIKQTGLGMAIFGSFFFFTWLINYFSGYFFSYYYLLLVAFFFTASVFLILAYWYKIRYLSLIVILLLGSVLFTNSVDYVFNNILKEHQRHRINSLLGIISDPHGVGYNVNQSKIAIGSGGFSGKGFLQGTQTKFHFVPEQSTDFIFCTVGEEWGFLGTFLVIGLFTILLLRIILLSEKQRSVFSRVFGYGVASILFFHITVNIGMTIGLLPVIGIPLPFFSYGGSSLWSFTILLFIFLRLDASRFELVA